MTVTKISDKYNVCRLQVTVWWKRSKFKLQYIKCKISILCDTKTFKKDGVNYTSDGSR
jgi:hypothetical protein